MDLTKIEEWTRIDNLHFWLDGEFEHIREEAECIEYDGEWDYPIIEEVNRLFYRDFPIFFNDNHFDELVSVEVYPFEKDIDQPDYNGFAVYIYFNEKLVKKLYKYLLDKQPDYVLKYVHWLGQL